MLHGTRITSDESAFDFARPSQAVGADGTVTVPDAHLLFNGDFQRHGSDLKIVGEGGKSFLVPDYFKGEKNPTLLSPEGASLTGDIVEALAGPRAPGQYAQAGQQASDQQPPIGRIEQVAGSATIVRNGVAITANQGDVVRKGDVVQTGDGGQIAVLFSDGSTFSLSANARMVLNDFVFQSGGANNSALISLVQGTIGFVAGQVAKTGDMRVETPVATMGIRGTAVLVEISANNGQTKFSVMVEPDGTTGSFNLYNKANGSLIATVNSSTIGWMVTPVGPLQVLAQQIQKTQAELAQELNYVQQLFNFFNQGQQNPFNPDDHTNVNPNTQFAGSGTQFLTSLPVFTFQEISNFFTNPTTFQFTPPLNPPDNPNLPPPPPDPIEVTITPNRAPVAQNDSGTPGENGDIIGDVIENDDDPDGDVIVVKSVQHVVEGEPQGDPVLVDEETGAIIEGEFGTLFIRADGTYEFTPNAKYRALGEGEEAEDIFIYTISDPSGQTASAQIIIDLTGVNDAPEAVADEDGVQAAGFVDDDFTLGDPIATGNVLANDTDVDAGDTKKVVGVKAGTSSGDVSGHVNQIIQGKYGYLVLLQNGKYVYTLNNLDPDTIKLAEGETGYDVFTYTMVDGDGETSTTTLTIDVEGANTGPVITGGDSNGSVKEDAVYSDHGTLHAVDVDNDDSLTWSVDLRNGQTRPEGGDATTVKGQYGTLVINQDGTWTYNLDNQAAQALGKNDHPVEIFTVRVTDEHGASDTQTVRVTVNGTDEPNTAPVAQNDTIDTLPAGWTVGANGHLYKYVPASFISWQQASAAAAQAGGYLATITSDTENNFIFSLVGNKVAWLGGSDAAQEGSWRWVTEPGGSIPFTYAPWAGGEPNNQGDWEYIFSGEDYLVTWGNKSWNDLDNSFSDRQLIDGYVMERNGDPATHYLTIHEQGAATFGANWLLDNDTDADGDTLTIVNGTITSTKGATVTFNNGTIVYNATQSSTLNALAAGQTTTDTFQYTVSDGHGGTSTAWVTVTVNGVNDAPTVATFIADEDIAYAENSAGSRLDNHEVIGKFTATDPDNGDSLEYSLIGSSHGFRLSQNGTLSTGNSEISSGEYNLKIRATDESGAHSDKDVVVRVGSSSSNTLDMSGQSKDVIVFGLNGGDTIATGSGDDVLVGGKGSDHLTGNDGADAFVFKPGDGMDVITDFSHSEGDKIDLSAFSHIDDFGDLQTYLDIVQTDTVIDFGNGHKITVQGYTSLAANDFIFHA